MRSHRATQKPRRQQNTRDPSGDEEYSLPRQQQTTSKRSSLLHAWNITHMSTAMHHASHTASAHQRNSTEVPFTEELAKAKIALRAGIEGEKKYSPPFGTTHSVGSVTLVPWLLGSTPDIFNSIGLSVWPIMGSSPGATGFFGGKLAAFAQPKQCQQIGGKGLDNGDSLCWINRKPLPMLLW